MDKKVTATSADLRAALKRYFLHPDYGIVFEVAKSTGHAAHRHLDAVAMDLWPSRGLELHGIEIKVSKQDLKRELANPAKADEIAAFCNRFWLAAPAGIAVADELPLSWGLLEYDGEHLILKKKAHAHPAPKEPTRVFLAAVFRAAGRIDADAIEAIARGREEALRAEQHGQRERAVEEAGRRWKGNAEAWSQFLKDVGESNWADVNTVVRRYRAARAMDEARHSLGMALNQAKHATKQLQDAVTATGETSIG